MMDDDKLKAITDQEIKQALGYGTGELTKQRLKALQYYEARPVGDLAPSEIQGRSSVVSTDVLDTVEWMLPALLEMFVSGDKVVEFKAKSEQFEQWEKHAEEFIGKHVFYVQNDGFLILQTWFKDALLSKNGIIKVWWDTISEELREDYTGLSDIELAMLLEDEHIEAIEHSEIIDPSGQVLHDIAVKRIVKKGYCKIDNVPPEELLISRRAKTLKTAPFVAHRFERTISELKSAGYENVDNLSSDDQDGAYGQERVERKMQNDETPYLGTRANSDNGDPSNRVVWVTECYIKIDYDQDGIQEWRKITRCGNQILENIECDGQPFISICPVVLPHQFFGLSAADLAMESQRTKTGLMRALIDNIYLSVNGRNWALEGKVNLDDLITSRPGGIVRVKQPDAVGPIIGPNGDTAGALQMLQVVDQAKESRTGYTRFSQGGDLSNAINSTATGMQIVTNREDARLVLIGRNFAQGVKDLFIKILELTSKYQDKAERIKATGGWVDIDPREWKNQFHLSINVGLGHGSKQEMLQKIQMLGQAMQQAAQAGIVQPKNVYNASIKAAEVLGFENADKFFTNPDQQPPQQKEDPQILTAKAMVEIERQKTEAKIAMDQRELDAKIAMNREELAAKIGLQREEFNHKVISGQMNDRLAAAGGYGYPTPAVGGGNPQQPAV